MKILWVFLRVRLIMRYIWTFFWPLATEMWTLQQKHLQLIFRAKLLDIIGTA